MASDSVTKIVLTVLIFMFGICGVLTPRLFDPFGHSISYANLIACGVIISAALVHLLSDASQTLNTAPLPRANGGKPYPWAYFICGLSFILLFFFERLLIHQLLHHHHHHDHNHDSKITVNINISQSSSLMHPHPHHDHHHGVVKEHANDMLELLNKKNYFSAIALLFGLSIHSILSGLALGSSLINSETMSLGIAILSHKYLASFALGCPLFKSVQSLKISILIAIFFALLTPTGIIIGVCLENTFNKNKWIADIFICVASGTFLYISICEIIIPEFSEEKKIEKKIYKAISYNNNLKKECGDKSCDAEHCKPKQNDNDDLRKMLCVLFGFGIMSLLAIWI